MRFKNQVPGWNWVSWMVQIAAFALYLCCMRIQTWCIVSWVGSEALLSDNGSQCHNFLGHVKFHWRLLLSRILPCPQTHQHLNCLPLSSWRPIQCKGNLPWEESSFFFGQLLCLLCLGKASKSSNSWQIVRSFPATSSYSLLVEPAPPLSAWKLCEEDGVFDLSNAVKWSLLVCLQSSCQTGIGIMTLCPTSYV